MNLTAPSYLGELEESVSYLGSDKAMACLKTDIYWPKWDSPWWHMLLLHEMGETQRIPENAISAFVAGLNRIQLKIFPIQPEDFPEGLDPFRGTPCHCQLGSVYQVLNAWGVDVDSELPWIRPWFLRYQMADGGYNCDNAAYLKVDETPSSMVGTIGVFESVLLHTRRPWTTEEETQLDRCAGFLIERQLKLGSNTKHNAAEQVSAKAWPKLCFPRFYLYDVLRGLNVLLLWAEKRAKALPLESVTDVIADLHNRFPGDDVRPGRLCYEGVNTILQDSSGEWRKQPAALFPLLLRVSAVDEISPFLSRQWVEAKRRIMRHANLRGLLT